MEVQLYRAKDKSLVLLHSKLKEQAWPKIRTILDKINKYLPLFTLNIDIKDETSERKQLFSAINPKHNKLSTSKFSSKEKDYEKDNQSANKDINGENNKNKEFTFKPNNEQEQILSDFRKSLNLKPLVSNQDNLKNIEIKVYQLNNPSIHEIIEYINNELEIIYNPKKRIEYDMMKRENIILEDNARYFHDNYSSYNINDRGNDDINSYYKNYTNRAYSTSSQSQYSKNYSGAESSRPLSYFPSSTKNNKAIPQISNAMNSRTRPETGMNRPLASIAETFYKGNELNSNYPQRLKSGNLSQRPATGQAFPNLYPNKKYQVYGSNSFTSRLKSSKSGSKIRPMSTFSQFNNSVVDTNTSYMNQSLQNAIGNNKYKFNNGDIIEDKEILSLIRGKLLIKDYSNDEGKISSYNLPYDLYLIEISPSSNFQGIASIIKFISTQSNISNKEENNVVKENNLFKPIFELNKTFPLAKQSNAFVQIFTYIVTDESEMDIEVVSGCKVYLKSIFEYGLDTSLYEDENKVELEELKDTKGKFQTIVEPGDYIVTCISEEYEVYCRKMSFVKGENIINLELKLEKKVEIEIQALDYFSGEKITDVSYEIKNIYNNKLIFTNKICKEGVVIINTLRLGDGINICFKKKGYYSSYRSIIRKEFNTSKQQMLLLPPVNTQYDKNISYNNNDANDISNILNFNVNTKVYLINKEEFKKQENLDMILIFYNNLNLFSRKLSNKENNDGNSEFEYNLEKNVSFDIELSEEASKYSTKKLYSKDSSTYVLELKFNEKEYCKKYKINNFNKIEIEGDLNHIARINVKLLDERLCNYYRLGKQNLNCLLLNCFEFNIYNSYGLNYFVNPPLFTSQYKYKCWDIGFIDLINKLFFELNILNLVTYERVSFFKEWIIFLEHIFALQKSQDLKILFGFDYAHTSKVKKLKDEEETIHEVAFIRGVKNLFNDLITPEFIIFLSDLFKNHNKMIAYSVLQQKIESNLINFK